MADLTPAQQTRLAQLRKQAAGDVPLRHVTQSLKIISHHGFSLKVDPDGEGGTQVTIVMSSKTMMSIARAYIENHLAEQLGSSANFEVVSGGTKIYIDLPAGR